MNAQREPVWLTNLRNELPLTPMKSGFTLTRDELQYLVDRLAAPSNEAWLDPQLAAFYQVDSVPALLAAMEEHIEKLQDSARRNVKPWEDTFPPTLLPKYLRENGLPEPAAPGVAHIHTHTIANPSGDQRQEGECPKCQHMIAPGAHDTAGACGTSPPPEAAAAVGEWPCLGCDRLTCRDCFTRAAEEAGYVRLGPPELLHEHPDDGTKVYGHRALASPTGVDNVAHIAYDFLLAAGYDMDSAPLNKVRDAAIAARDGGA